MKRSPRRIDRLTPEQRQRAVLRRLHRQGRSLQWEATNVHALFKNKRINTIALADVLREVVPLLNPWQTPEGFVQAAIKQCPPACRLRLQVRD